MSPSPPFINEQSGSLNTDQIRAEAFPLAGLIMLVAGLALLPYIFVVADGGSSGLSAFLTLVAQFILAVGTGIVLMYVIARGIQLSGE